jgi:hypothetical protein
MKIPTRVLAQAQALAHGASRERAVRIELLTQLRSRPNGLWTLPRLAAMTGLPPGQIDAELAALLVDQSRGQLGKLTGRHVLRHHVHGWSCGLPGVYEHLRVPSAYEIERWVHQGDHAALDAALAATGTAQPRSTATAPVLRWGGGEALSPGAQAWVLNQLLADTFVTQEGEGDGAKPVRGAAGLIEPALEGASAIALSQWVLGAPLPASMRARVLRTDAVLDWIAEQVEGGELSRSRALEMMGSDRIQARRWAFRWGELRSARDPDAVSDERIEGLWPTQDDATGTVAQWSEHIGQVLRRAMIEQRGWPMDLFCEAYLWHPVAAAVATGLVYRVGGLPVAFIDGRAHGIDGPLQLELGGEIRVAHPAGGTEDWPLPAVPAPFEQRGHVVLGVEDLPSPSPQPLPHGVWKRRVRALRLLSDAELGGGTTAELWLLPPYRIRIDHAGYGAGYGGARPVGDIQVTVRVGGQPPLARLTIGERSGWERLPAWLVSEIAAMLRVLLQPGEDGAAPGQGG